MHFILVILNNMFYYRCKDSIFRQVIIILSDISVIILYDISVSYIN